VLTPTRASMDSQKAVPKFEVFDAEISEIRFTVQAPKRTYRIYGTFWPTTHRNAYTFLVGKDKKVKNDKAGKKLAEKRLKELIHKNNGAGAHVFRFN